MTALKCKLCGGNIEITGESHGICDSCGSEVTLPKIDDDKRADMYNRGNHFRQIGDFDRAYSAYEHIIADDGGDAEAHWCLTLCRYGVEYVKDPRTGEFKPTVSRMSYERVLDDPDYLAALAASDEYTKEIYRREAQKIDRIQSRYLEISRKEPPYDVFICFKAEEENGQRTKGSVLAQDAYEQLTAKGLKVFFSRITLESKLSEEYEPYIFAALHSAKVMLLTADKPEQLQARWVKNEWSRYLNMMDQDKGKHIVPVFVDMSPYDFPAEIPTVQGQDMSRVGAMQDLVRGVCKLTGHVTEAPAAQAAAAGGVMTKNLLTRARQAVEDKDFDEASRIVDDILNREPENGEAYYYGLLAKFEITYLPTRPSKEQWDWIDDRYFKRAMQYESGDHKEDLTGFHNRCNQARELVRAEAMIGREEYQKALDTLNGVEERAKAGGFPVADEAGVHRLRKEAKQGIARKEAEAKAAEELRKKVAAYHAEIDPPGSYLRRTIKKRYPDKFEKYEKMENTKQRIAGNIYDSGIGFFALLCSLLMILGGINTYMLPESAAGLLIWSVGACVAGSCIFLDEFIGFIATAIITAIVTFGGGLLLETVFEPGKLPMFLLLILPLLGVLCVIRGIQRTIASVRWNSLYNAVKKYERKEIGPLEEQIREEVRKRWEGQIGAANLVKLPGCFDK